MCNGILGDNCCTWVILLVIILLVCNNGDCGCNNNCSGCGCQYLILRSMTAKRGLQNMQSSFFISFVFGQFYTRCQACNRRSYNWSLPKICTFHPHQGSSDNNSTRTHRHIHKKNRFHNWLNFSHALLLRFFPIIITFLLSITSKKARCKILIYAVKRFPLMHNQRITSINI